MKVVFVDHHFHTKTQSSNFFLKLLKDHFVSVDISYVKVDGHRTVDVLNAPRAHDIAILWQVDFLAPAFLAAGYRTIVIPMYDGSAGMPYEHWLSMRDASFINFSRSLHERALGIGARSYLAKYFVPPCPEEKLPTFKALRGFLWMRRPDQGLTPKLVERLLGSQLTHLHVHNAPDDGTPRLLKSPQYSTRAFPITESRWSASRTDYINAIAKANVFIAPRLSEGIGLAMLEALSQGCLVLANDDAVHNEYIANWISGILFNINSSYFHLSLTDAQDLSRIGWRAAREGYNNWLDSISGIIAFIKEAPTPKPNLRGLVSTDLLALWDAYALGIDTYRRFLRENVIDLASDDLLSGVAAPILADLRNNTSVIPSLDQGEVFFGKSPNTLSRKFGFIEADAISARLSSFSAGFQFRCEPIPHFPDSETITIHCSLETDASEPWMILAHINNELAFQNTLPMTAGDFRVDIPITRHNDPISCLLSFISTSTANKPKVPPPILFMAVQLGEQSP